MDVNALREAAIEAANRALYEKHGFVPSEDSDEWEEEYRRQFEQARKRHAAGHPVAVKPDGAAAPPQEDGWAVLSGAPTQIRWAAAVRADRLNEMLGRIERAYGQRQQFLADASHELRTPVAAIVTTAEVSLRHPRSTEAYRGTLETCLADARLLRTGEQQ